MTEVPFRNALEEIVLELQTRLLKEKFELDIAKGAEDYARTRLHIKQVKYLQLQNIYNYISALYECAVNVKKINEE